MPPLPCLSGLETVRIFERLGWQIARQKGSHIIMTQKGSIATLSIPNHREIAKGTLRGLIRAAHLTVDQFINTIEQE